MSANSMPSPAVEEIEADINNAVMSVKKEIITENFKEKKAAK